MSSPLVCAVPALFYAALVIPRIAEVWQAVPRPELSGIAALLGSPVGATIAWMHFLAFDLFVGRWIYLDSRERGIAAWIMGPGKCAKDTGCPKELVSPGKQSNNDR